MQPSLIELLRAYKLACFKEASANIGDSATARGSAFNARMDIEVQLIDRFRAVSEAEQMKGLKTMAKAIDNRGEHKAWCAVRMAGGQPCTCIEAEA